MVRPPIAPRRLPIAPDEFGFMSEIAGYAFRSKIGPNHAGFSQVHSMTYGTLSVSTVERQ
jgi:hypothetical protein